MEQQMNVRQLKEMTWYHLTLEPGAIIHHELKKFFEKEGLEHAFILSCVGSCSKVVVAYPKTNSIPPELGKIESEGLYEINTIGGDIRKDASGIRVHLHGSFTRDGEKLIGGAIHEGTKTFLTAEFVIVGTASTAQ